MLATLATAEELALVEGALAALDAASFRALFDPAEGGRAPIPLPPPAIVRPLLAFGLAAHDAGGIVGRHRVRRIGGRFYVMELGIGELEYLQDVWPETDALLGELDHAAPGRLLDLGTGSGVIAVEAAARGHRVVATDVYETALILARFNARLNRLDGAIEFREGHLFAPVAGERFDRVLTNPHYGRTDDQLRLEVLRAAPAHLRPGGELVLATALEWEAAAPDREAGARRLAVEHLLAPLAESGLAVEVAPIAARYKRDWFAAARAEEPIARLVSRHRFLVRVTRPATPRAGALEVRWPEERELAVRDFVPLARVARGGVHAVVTSAADVARVAALCEKLRAAEARFDEPLPRGLLDGCRFGARRCVAERGAAGAILDARGGVRPCTHGDPIARAEDSLAEVEARLAALAQSARLARGCATCAAESACSQCLFPVVLDVPAYCDFVRAHVRELPLLHRLGETVAQLDELGAPEGALAIIRATDDSGARGSSGALAAVELWHAARGGRAAIAWRAGGGLRWSSDAELTAAAGAILAGSSVPPALGDRLASLIGAQSAPPR